MLAKDMISYIDTDYRYPVQKNDHSFGRHKWYEKCYRHPFYSGYNILPNAKMYWGNICIQYWGNASDIGTCLVNRAMYRKWYSDIRRYLHLNDNSLINKECHYYKIHPLLEKPYCIAKIYNIFRKFCNRWKSGTLFLHTWL